MEKDRFILQEGYSPDQVNKYLTYLSDTKQNILNIIKLIKTKKKIDIDGEVYRVMEGDNGKKYLTYGTKIYAKGFDDIRDLQNIGGKIACICVLNGKESIIRGKKYYIEEFVDRVEGFQLLGNDLVALVDVGGEKMILKGENIIEHEEIEQEHDFWIFKDQKKMYLAKGNQKISQGFDIIDDEIKTFQGKPLYIASIVSDISDDADDFIIRGKRKINCNFDIISHFEMYGNILCVEGVEGNNLKYRFYELK